MPFTGRRILTLLGWGGGVLAAVVLIFVLYVQLTWDSPNTRPAPDLQASRDSATIARGEYIYKYQALCWGCHITGSEPSGGPGMFPAPVGGFSFDLSQVGPGFGVWYARNITPDVETGIGGWSDGEIVQALREGVSRDRRTLFPIMPIDWYHQMADEDILAIVAYLRTLKRVSHRVPDNEPSFFAKALLAFGMMAPKEAVTSPLVSPSAGITAEYGEYLASNLSGCADCHTPRNLQDGKFYLDSLFAGSSFPFGEDNGSPIQSYARNITPDPETGIGSWSEEEFTNVMTTGVRPDGTVLTTHMPYAHYKAWNPDDLKAVFVYLRTIPPIRRTVPPNESVPELSATRGAERGALQFKARCENCHGNNGAGAPPTNVSLAEVAASLSDAELIEFIAVGQPSLYMPGFGKTLSGQELSDLVAFIRTWEKDSATD